MFILFIAIASVLVVCGVEVSWVEVVFWVVEVGFRRWCDLLWVVVGRGSGPCEGGDGGEVLMRVADGGAVLACIVVHWWCGKGNGNTIGESE